MALIDPATAREEFTKLLNWDREEMLRALSMEGGLVVLNADDLFMRYPPYREQPLLRMVLGPALYGVARDYTNWAFSRLLADPASGNETVIFTAGGGASGKSSVLRALVAWEGVAFIVDTTFSDPVRAAGQVEAALSSGRTVEVNYVYRRFEHSVREMLKRAQDPAVGRVVPVNDLARTHHGAQVSVLLLRQRYDAQPRFAMRFWKTVEGGNPRSLTLAELHRRIHPSVDELRRQGHTLTDAISNGEDGQWTGQAVSESLRRAAQS